VIGGYFVGASFSIFSHVSILGNLGGGFIVAKRLICRQSVHKFEIIGTIVSIVGSIVMVQDKNIGKINSNA
jgi:hypothetical protein